VAAAVVSTAVLGACGAGGTSTADRRPTSTAPAADDPLDDAAVCAAYGDVMTIVENADLGLADGRMAAQERDGWHRLATRVLDRLPSGEDSAVRSAIARLQEAAPADPPGYDDPIGVGSPEWDDAQFALGAACDDAGSPLGIMVFTGG
jgi:hypothetical protein